MTRRLRLALVPSLLVFVAAGCVSLTPVQQGTVAEVQRFADATAAAYGLMRIPVTIQAGTNLGIGGVYRQGNFYLNADMLDSGHLTAVVAHELGHYVLGHEPISGVSMAEVLRAQEPKELDANAKAVDRDRREVVSGRGRGDRDGLGRDLQHCEDRVSRHDHQ